MITPLITGALVKLGVNVVNGYMHNLAEERRNNALRDKEIVKAQMELAKQVQSDKISKIIRGTIFLMIVSVWCYLAVHGAHNPNLEYDIVVPKGNNWTFGSLFSSSQWEIRKISGSVLMWQWFTLVEMILGFFVVPSRRR